MFGFLLRYCLDTILGHRKMKNEKIEHLDRLYVYYIIARHNRNINAEITVLYCRKLKMPSVALNPERLISAQLSMVCEIFKILQIQKRIVFVGTIHGNMSG